MLPNRAMARNTSRLLASRNISEAGIRASCGRSRPGGGRSRARSISVSSSVLPSCATATLFRSWVRVRRKLLVDFAAARVQLRRQLVLDQRLIELAGRGEPPAAIEVIGRRRAASRDRAPAARPASSGLRRSALVYSTTARSYS